MESPGGHFYTDKQLQRLHTVHADERIVFSFMDGTEIAEML